MSIQIPSGPFLVPPYEPEHGGVDFLGLRQANLELMAVCLPGINNVTSYVRAFSLLSWIHWKFHKLATERGQRQVSLQSLRGFRERVEVLFTWGHVLNGLGGLPGANARPPGGDGSGVPLTFRDWKRTHETTSLMAPVQYGPASKTLGGLGFLEQVESGFYRACGEGVRLAEALDPLISTSDGAQLLGLESQNGTEADARSLFAAWDVRSPTEDERAAFRRAFFNEQVVENDSETGRRSATVALAREVLSWAHHPMTLDELRKRMVYARQTGLPPLEVPTKLAAARLRWSVLQVRQAQRFAHECLLVWLERRLQAGVRDTEGLVSRALAVLQDMGFEGVNALTVGALARQWIPQAESFETLWELALSDGGACIFTAIERITQALWEEEDTLVAHSLRTLFLCARAAELLAVEPVAERAMRVGGIERVSLKHWRDTAVRCGTMLVREFLLLLFEGLVLSQHFAVAASRFDGGTQRLRITIEEEGLTLLAADPWWPRLTPDRLAAALSLAEDCGLIGSDQEGRYMAL